MDKRTFNLVDAVCREGLTNDTWGVIDGGNTANWFGSEERLELDGMFLYVYANDPQNIGFLQPFLPDIILHGEDEWVILLYKLE